MSPFSRFSGRLALVAIVVLGVAACSSFQKSKKPAPAPAREKASSDIGPPPNVSACRAYADQMAGRQLEQDYDSIQGNFQGGSSPVFRDFARMDAERYYRQLYESCLSQHRQPAQEAPAR